MVNLAMHATTILAVRRSQEVAIAGDGQVTLGDTVMKQQANKLRRLNEGKVIAGFAGSVADAFNLFELFEKKLEQYKGNLTRSAVEMAKEWRTDKILRRLESLLLVADLERILLLSGSGEVIEPDEEVAGIGSGGSYALAAAKALLKHTDLSAAQVAKQALEIAADICVYTNHEIKVEKL